MEVESPILIEAALCDGSDEDASCSIDLAHSREVYTQRSQLDVYLAAAVSLAVALALASPSFVYKFALPTIVSHAILLLSSTTTTTARPR